mgnify:CR=1 FL=1
MVAIVDRSFRRISLEEEEDRRVSFGFGISIDVVGSMFTMSSGSSKMDGTYPKKYKKKS